MLLNSYLGLFRGLYLKNKKILFLISLSMITSSCGLIERFKTPEQPIDSKETPSTAENTPVDGTDDLFSKTMEENQTPQSDDPTQITSNDETLKELEDEFSASPATASSNDELKKESDKPVIVEESVPEIKAESIGSSQEGEEKNYTVKRGETLMQIAFKLYGDISKWKEIKQMNSQLLSSNTALKQGAILKYRAPSVPFTWKPSGSPYLIKTGETLGTISSNVYKTPAKWKILWENNKPMIKNPNLIYAGFTLYYENGGMANYVQPKSEQSTSRKEIIEEVNVDELASAAEQAQQKTTQTITDTQVLAPTTTVESDIEEQSDESSQTLSAPKREEKEIDLINNIQSPIGSEEDLEIDELL